MKVRHRRTLLRGGSWLMAAVGILSCGEGMSLQDGGNGGEGGGSLARECQSPGTGWIWCDDFEEDRLGSYFEYDARNGSFVRVGGVGVGGSSGLRARFAAGQENAGSLKAAFGRTPSTYFRALDTGTADHREIYWRHYLRLEPGWTGGGGYKLSRATVFATASWAQAMIAHVWSGGSGSAVNHLYVDPARGTDPAGTLLTTQYNDAAHLTWLGSAGTGIALFDASHVGRWYCIEARVRLNDPGASNGVQELWIDGALEAQRTGLNFLGRYDAFGLNAIFLENYWNNGSPAAQERYLDNFVISTRRIGCGESP